MPSLVRRGRRHLGFRNGADWTSPRRTFGLPSLGRGGYGVVIMLCFLSTQMSRVQCSWITQHPIRQSRQSRFSQRHHHWHVRRPSSAKDSSGSSRLNTHKFGWRTTGDSRCYGTSSRLWAQWSVGDAVSVRVNDELREGIIQETRGSGWYSVHFSDSNPKATIKCRSSELRAVVESSTSTPGRSVTAPVFVPPNPERPTIPADPGTPPTHIPPPPTIHDLDALLMENDRLTNARDRELLKQVQHHATLDKWVVFTDLHCSPSSLDTCLEVLTQVHQLAVARKAGVLFLGDFWHHRGTLRVDCLNAVLEHLRSWTVPLIMIPGNHDQVTLGGQSHGLTPLEHAFRVSSGKNEGEQSSSVPGPLVLSYPTKFRNALFVPHIRDIATMESILQSPIAHEASALMVHAEVTGALMNDLIVSHHGIPPASFPMDKWIYSGHFHKPHVVTAGQGIRIEYLGSPYQTTLSEAHQSKSLAVLDASKDWKCIEYIPMDIGRRHFKVASMDELTQLRLQSDQEIGSTVLNEKMRRGDRIVASISKELLDNLASEVDAHIQDLRKGGVMVEIREVKAVADQALGSGSAIEGMEEEVSLEELTPESVWRAYLLEEEQQRETVSSDAAAILLEAGLEVLQEVQSNTIDSQMDRRTTMMDLELTSVAVEGFGPFRKRTTYPLSNRGLVLLKGTNNDSGSDSNGSGKSSLAMAALWALTGSLDPRRTQDGKVSDVVHDESKTARVTLEGTSNGSSFIISRTKTPTKGNLIFQLGGVDLTTQSAKETQELIEERLGVSPHVLSRTMFHGQHGMNELLEATDAKFKEELSLLVPLVLWQKAATLSRAKSKEAGKKASEYAGMIALRSEDIEKLSAKRSQAEENVELKREALARLQKEYKESANDDAAATETTIVDFDDLQVLLENVSSDLEMLENKHRQLETESNSAMEPIRKELESATTFHESMHNTVKEKERDVYGATLRLDMATTKVKELEVKWNIDLKHGRSEVIATPETCPTCQQPIASTGDGHSHEALVRKMETEIDQVLDQRQAAKVAVEASSKQLADCEDQLQTQTEQRQSFENDLNALVEKWNTRMSDTMEALETKRHERSNLSARMAAAARQSQEQAKGEAAMATITSQQSALSYAIETHTSVAEEWKEAEARLESLKEEILEQKRRDRTMSDLSVCFGQRGVQTFVLQNVVDTLQMLSQSYLDDLSDGAQRLELALDAGDRIARSAYVCGADGVFKERPLATLSGGQWRRCSLALTFGFAELVARRGHLRPSMCVLDEPLTHLDRSGRSKVGDVIRRMLRPTSASSEGAQSGGMGMSTVLLILQDLAAEELDEAFDCIDEVVKEDSESFVKVDGFQDRK